MGCFALAYRVGDTEQRVRGICPTLTPQEDIQRERRGDSETFTQPFAGCIQQSRKGNVQQRAVAHKDKMGEEGGGVGFSLSPLCPFSPSAVPWLLGGQVG